MEQGESERRAGYVQMHTDIALVKEIVERLEHRLFEGNGGEGEIPDLKHRLGCLEKWFWRMSGFLFALLWLTNTLGPELRAFLKLGD